VSELLTDNNDGVPSVERTPGPSPSELRSVARLCRSHPGFLELLRMVAERQPESTRSQRRADATASGLMSQLAYTTPLFPITVARAVGAYLWDADGNRLLDCHMAYSASILGHNPAPVVAAVQAALENGVGAGYVTEAHVELAELVCGALPGAERVAFFHSGTEAVAAAVRMARAASGRRRVVKFEGCYHGSSELGVHNSWMNLSGRIPDDPVTNIRPRPDTGGVFTSEDVIIMPFGSDAVFDLLADAADIGAVLVDPMPPFACDAVDQVTPWLVELRAATAKARVPLVFDEVVTGFRLAPGGAQAFHGVTADLVALGKITSGLGIALSMVAGRAGVLDTISTDGLWEDHRAGKAWLSTTHSANYLAVAASLAQLQMLVAGHDDYLARLDASHMRLAEGIDAIARRLDLAAHVGGHPRLQSALSLHRRGAAVLDYRQKMAETSTTEIVQLVALGLALRLEGVYSKSVPVMNLSVAHGDGEVDLLLEAVASSLERLQGLGIL